MHAVTNGSPRDLMKIVEMLERYLPASLAAKPESLEVSYHRAEGSTVPLPPARLFEP